MPIDIVDLLEEIAGLVTGAIALLAAYRSLMIGRSLVTRVYRTRAYWLTVLMVIFAVLGILPTYTSLETDISNIFFFAFLVALLVFIDSNVAVAKEIDFFHKDILHWNMVRIPLLVIVVAYTAVASVASFLGLSTTITGVGVIGYIVVAGAAFSYSGAAMFVIARKTYDRTMKKFVKMLGFAVLFWVLFLTLFIPLDVIYPSLGDVVTSYIAIAAAYFFYRAAMSLSMVGRIVKEAF